MLQDVDEKTYQFGMLRALGFNTMDLKITICAQSFCFSIPGLALGLFFASVFNIVIRHLVFVISNNTDTYFLSNDGLAIALGIGLLMPMLANYFPIERALSRNLTDSLDLYHRSLG